MSVVDWLGNEGFRSAIVEIRFAGYMAASWLLEQQPKKWHSLVLLDSGLRSTEFLQENSVSCCTIVMDDIEGPIQGKSMPSTTLVESALKFASGKPNLLVSCRAGQGRSAAMAYLISSLEHGVMEAISLLNPRRHRPNELIVALGDSLHKAAGILETFRRWRHENVHVRLSDFYEEMEREFDALESLGARNRICR